MTSNPTPGSDEAVAQGCTCPVLDNGRGRGAYQVGGEWQFWVSTGCPLHYLPAREKLAASEPVAWALCSVDGKAILADTETDYLEKVRFQFDRDDAADAPHSLRPLVFADHPTTPTRGSDE